MTNYSGDNDLYETSNMCLYLSLFDKLWSLLKIYQISSQPI
jgi:hypothetical protein